VCDGFVGCCMRTSTLVDMVSRSWLMGAVENDVVFGKFKSPSENWFSWGDSLLNLFVAGCFAYSLQVYSSGRALASHDGRA